MRSFLMGTYPGVELLGHRESICSKWLQAYIVFKVSRGFYSTARAENCCFKGCKPGDRDAIMRLGYHPVPGEMHIVGEGRFQHCWLGIRKKLRKSFIRRQKNKKEEKNISWYC